MSKAAKIMQCENKYAECFCKPTEQQGFIRFRDEMIPDMYYHNYTRITGAKADAELVQIIETEIAHSKAEGKDFCLIRCHVPVNDTALARLPYTPDVSMAGHYLLEIANMPELKGVSECSVRRVDKHEMLEDILRLDLEHDGESLGKDFCTRRIYRRKDVYLSDEGVDSYICYAGGEAVGNCDLFIFGDTAKIEDFSVSPRHQRKGYGTAILKALIETAVQCGVTAVYLEADEDATAKEMYVKCGFYIIHEFTDLLFMM